MGRRHGVGSCCYHGSLENNRAEHKSWLPGICGGKVRRGRILLTTDRPVFTSIESVTRPSEYAPSVHAALAPPSLRLRWGVLRAF
jgi:hypothetical protein